MPNLPEIPRSEHPKEVRRWVLECLGVLWTESGTGWQVDPKQNLMRRTEGDFTFELFLRPSQRVKTGFVKVFPEWRIQSQRWVDWCKERGAARVRQVFASPIRKLDGSAQLPSDWYFVSPISLQTLYEPDDDYGGGAPIPELRLDVSPIFNAIHNADAFAELAHTTNLGSGSMFMTGANERIKYFVAIDRPDLARQELARWPRCLSPEEITALGLSVR
jgi:hypothetical protein